ncbi:OLC1v1024638C1 [Oldenlandia corymbosa var. corymbosa]|uniref:OLC1v1024638C1 n=1 Tax=Oldenlandia corymbosa var. corymbosa TaxID=529605 RepID=A0AAV1C4M8_OLDCO|nr:OLC1v1024638C1 [Oldenlandia corymbosa var. corymbosa]
MMGSNIIDEDQLHGVDEGCQFLESIALNKDSVVEVANEEIVRQLGGSLATGNGGLDEATEDKKFEKNVGHDGTLHEDAPHNDDETLDRVYKLCRDEISFAELFCNMMSKDKGDTHFNVESFNRGTSWANQPAIGDHEARTNDSSDDHFGSSEGLDFGKTVNGKSTKYGNEQRTNDGTDISQDNANIELQKKPNSEDEGDAQAARYPDFGTLDGVPQFRVRDKFDCKNDFKNAIKSYMMLTGRPVYMYTNDSTRLRAKCRAPCKWFVYAKKNRDEGVEYFYVHYMRDIHIDCIPENTNKKVTAKWLANTYLEKTRADPHIPISGIQKWVDDDFHIKVTRSKAYKARDIAQKTLNRNAGERGRQQKKKGAPDDDNRLYEDGTERIKKHVKMHCNRCTDPVQMCICRKHNWSTFVNCLVPNKIMIVPHNKNQNDKPRNIRSNARLTPTPPSSVPIGDAEIGGGSVEARNWPSKPTNSPRASLQLLRLRSTAPADD